MHCPSIVAALTLWAATTRAQEPDATLLRWRAPASCPSQVEVRAALERNLGRPLTARDARELQATARVRPRADGRWALELRLDMRRGGRVGRALVAESCELLATAAALVVAVAIDPLLDAAPPNNPADPAPRTAPPDGDASRAFVGTAAVPQPDPLAASPVNSPLDPPAASPVNSPLDPPAASPVNSPLDPPAASPVNSPPDPPAAPPAGARPGSARALSDRRGAPRWALAALVGLDVGALPRPAPALALRTGALWRRVRLEVGLGHWFEQSTREPSGPRGADLRLTAGHVQACPRLFAGPVELPVCAGLELGAMHGVGVNVTSPRSDRVLWLALLAGGRVVWAPRRRLALVAELGIAAPLMAVRFQVQGLPGDVHRAAPAALRGGLGLELRFP